MDSNWLNQIRFKLFRVFIHKKIRFGCNEATLSDSYWLLVLLTYTSSFLWNWLISRTTKRLTKFYDSYNRIKMFATEKQTDINLSFAQNFGLIRWPTNMTTFHKFNLQTSLELPLELNQFSSWITFKLHSDSQLPFKTSLPKKQLNEFYWRYALHTCHDDCDVREKTFQHNSFFRLGLQKNDKILCQIISSLHFRHRSSALRVRLLNFSAEKAFCVALGWRWKYTCIGRCVTAMQRVCFKFHCSHMLDE
jgi:hypothetical protein